MLVVALLEYGGTRYRHKKVVRSRGGRIDYGKNYGTRLPRRDRGAPDNHNQDLKKTIGIVTCKTTLFIFRG